MEPSPLRDPGADTTENTESSEQTCRHGHPWSEQVPVAGGPRTRCRVCVRDANRRHRQKTRDAVRLVAMLREHGIAGA